MVILKRLLTSFGPRIGGVTDICFLNFLKSLTILMEIAYLKNLVA